jgi:hypothetical protein
LFPDALGLLGLAWQEFGEGRGMRYKVQTRKAGHATPDGVLFMSSFKGLLPKVFGTSQTDLRVLPDAKGKPGVNSFAKKVRATV